MRISDWSSDVCASDLAHTRSIHVHVEIIAAARHCFALAVAMRRSEQRLALPLRARLDKRRNAGISEIRSSEERRVGKARVSTCRSRWAPFHKKNTHHTFQHEHTQQDTTQKFSH